MNGWKRGIGRKLDMLPLFYQKLFLALPATASRE